MAERYKPREVYKQARQTLSPWLREQGYRRSTKTGPGPSWERDTGSGYLLFGVHAGPYLDVMGGRFQVNFDHEHYPLRDLDMLSWLSDEQTQTWFDLTWNVYERAQGRVPGSDASEELHRQRQDILSHILIRNAFVLRGLGWPWFQPSDLPPYFDFIVSTQREVEQRLLLQLSQGPRGW